MNGRVAGAVIGVLTLAGCSYPYDLQAVVIHGRLAFIVDPGSQHKPNCFRSIHIETDEEARAAPTTGDDRKLIANGVFWWRDFAVDGCPNRFPILYGQPLSGKPFAYQDSTASAVQAKPLRIGVVYEVDTASSGSAYGSARFRIRADHTVENLPAHAEQVTTGSVR